MRERKLNKKIPIYITVPVYFIFYFLKRKCIISLTHEKDYNRASAYNIQPKLDCIRKSKKGGETPFQTQLTLLHFEYWASSWAALLDSLFTCQNEQLKKFNFSS